MQLFPLNSHDAITRPSRKQSTDIDTFYRVFEALRIGHCLGVPGGQPITIVDAMVAWVEKGTLSDSLPVFLTAINGTGSSNILFAHIPRKLSSTLAPETRTMRIGSTVTTPFVALVNLIYSVNL